MTVILRHACGAAVAFLLVGAAVLAAAAATASADQDMAVARSLAEMLQAARTVVSDAQDLINNPSIGDKHLTGQVVLKATIEIYSKTTGADPKKIDRNSREGRLLNEMMAAIVAVVDDNQATINAQGVGFKAFIPATFARLVAEEFGRLAKGEAEVKVTAPPELVRNRKARPDQWESEIIKTKLLDSSWPAGQSYSASVVTNGRPAFRFMVPEYYVESCLACHGSPKGEMDITGYPKEGGKLNDLGAAISITLYH